MLFLVTGTPGSGKTLNTIKYINERSQFKGRDIYYFNIKDLDPAFGWIQLTEEEAYNWHDLPSHSVIVFDEAYDIFPAKSAGKNSPDHVQKLAVHRHKGFDIFLITQKSVGQVDTFIRGLINRHQHYARIMGSKVVNRFEWDTCQNNTDSKAIKKDANKTTLKFDKKYFGRYHSADEHTHTYSIPWRLLIILLVGVTVIGGAVYVIYHQFVGDDVQSSASYSNQYSPSPVGGSYRPSERKSQSFAELANPDVPGMPWSAPMYSEVIEAKTWPRPAACVHFKDRDIAVCYTQQGTRMHLSREVILQIVEEGFFDWTKEEGGSISLPPAHSGVARMRGEGDTDALAYHDYNSAKSDRTKIIRHTPKERMQTGKGRPTGQEQPVYELVPRGPSELTPAQRQFF